MSRTRPVAVSIHATSPGLMGPPTTAWGCVRKRTPPILAATTSRKGSAENSRIRSVLLLNCASVIDPAPPMTRCYQKRAKRAHLQRQFGQIDGNHMEYGLLP